MKMTITLLFLFCCIVFLLTRVKSAPGAPGGLGQRGPKAEAVKPKEESLPFCPIDKKTTKRIAKITALLKKSTAVADKGKTIATKRVPRETLNCDFPYPNCGLIALRVENANFATHYAMFECCSDCQDKNFTFCLNADRPCRDCIFERITCINECIVEHFCPEKETSVEKQGSKGDTGTTGKKGQPGAKGKPGTKGAKGQPGTKGTKGDTGSTLCPTSKDKNIDGSYCLRRSCIPIHVLK